MDVGSEDCKFTRKAIITLVGNYGASPVVTGFGSKFLGVAAGGSLELHGLDPSPSWTKLTSTVQSSVTLGSANMTTLGRGFNVASKRTRCATFHLLIGRQCTTLKVLFLATSRSTFWAT